VNKLDALTITVLNNDPQEKRPLLRLFEAHVDIRQRGVRNADGIRHPCRPVVAHNVLEVGTPHAGPLGGVCNEAPGSDDCDTEIVVVDNHG
jgi:hypothetical protein